MHPGFRRHTRIGAGELGVPCFTDVHCEGVHRENLRTAPNFGLFRFTDLVFQRSVPEIPPKQRTFDHQKPFDRLMCCMSVPDQMPFARGWQDRSVFLKVVRAGLPSSHVKCERFFFDFRSSCLGWFELSYSKTP